MKKTLALFTLVALAALSTLFLENTDQNETSFEQWRKKYPVNFDETELVYRKIIFEKNLLIIANHNSDASKTYKMAVNQFTAYTEEEFKAIFLGQVSLNSRKFIEIIESEPVPNVDIDWTTKGKVSRVKNQGQCGSCWAFSAVASCESWALLQSKTADLSEQQLVDCSGSYGNHGCNGGARGGALKYIKDHGIDSESAYPYKGVNEACKKQGGAFKITTISESSACSGIVNALEGRPVSVAVDAGGWSHYSSGVFNNCGKNINHAVLLVGVINGVWKIKNSWGTSWGEKGFIRLAAGDTCGICQQGAVWPH